MKIPSIVDKFFSKKQQHTEIFSSLILDEEYVAASLWEMDEHSVPNVLAADSKPCQENTWESRLDAVDEALAAVEDAVGTIQYTKVVLGLPFIYLTESGEIRKEVRPHIKMITRELELTPIGFVPVSQALLYTLKKEEGIPPSVILLGISRDTLSVSIYRVGVLTGQQIAPRSGDVVINFEEILKTFKDLEVLPARILLYGHGGKNLEDIKTELLRYPWTTRVNFLHFPKIEIVTPEDAARAVSAAGASEISHEVTEMPEVSEDPEEEDEIAEEAMPAGRQESNVVAVDPAILGFRKNVDVLETVEQPKKSSIKIAMPKIPNIDFSVIKDKPKFFLIGGIVGLIFIFGFLYWFVPHATVTIVELPKSILESEQITIDPTATMVDAQNKIIPGVKQEKSVSEDKTIAVTGKKNVGDPAKGTITLYNKTLNTQTFSKGTVLTQGTLEFSLDDSITVDAATVTGTLGSETKTFGQKNSTITASAIGTESNLSANKTFSIKGFSTDQATAVNSQALAGGTSKQVTVVSRADQDALVAAASKDLVDQAKQGLTGSVAGNQKLIDETIATTVTQKSFTQELDQEAAQLAGKVTVTVSGISYNSDDMKTLLTAFITGDIPSGYTLAEGRTEVTVSNIKVAKDGKISAKATIKTDAVPTLNLADIRKHITGKKISDAEAYMRTIQGIAAVEVRFSVTFSKLRLPINEKNIIISTAIQ